MFDELCFCSYRVKPHGVNARAVTASEVVETKIGSDDFQLNAEVSGIGLRPVLSYI